MHFYTCVHQSFIYTLSGIAINLILKTILEDSQVLLIFKRKKTTYLFTCVCSFTFWVLVEVRGGVDFLFIMWILGIMLRSLGLSTSTLTEGAISPTQVLLILGLRE